MPKAPAFVSPLYLKKVRIRDVRCLGDIDFDFSRGGQGWQQLTMLLGANGAGKSTFLRALAIGLSPQKEASALISDLAGHFIRQNKRGTRSGYAEILVTLHDPDNKKAEHSITTRIEQVSGQERVSQETLPADTFPWKRVFVCGYGVNRGGRRHATVPAYSVRGAVASLFRDDATLLEPESLLQSLKLAELQHEKNSISFAEVWRHLRTVLRLKPSHRIDVSSQHILVHGPWGAMPFHALGDGYRGTAGWLLDMFGLAQRAGFIHPQKGPAGVVLIDELDEHLHPSWQREIVGLLKRRFPLVQFVGSSHSPLTVVNCEAGEVALCQLKNTVASITRDLPHTQGRSADQLLRGEWFGLRSTVDNKSQKLLDQYRKALGDKRASKKTRELREALREQMGYLVASPLDELAAGIAAELRDQYATAKDSAAQKKLIEQAARKLRAQIKRAG